MNTILIHDIRPLELPTRKTVARFSVSLVNEDDEPMFTMVGWLYDAWRKLQAPRVRSSTGKYMAVVKLYPDFVKMMKKHLEEHPEIQKILDPIRATMPALGWEGRDDNTY